jgi:four helix bundle protein
MKRTESQTKPYQTFEDLEVYQVARGFRKAMYRIARPLPEEEKFTLASQIRRGAVSQTNNIAEGHGRFHFLEQIEFMLQARGSLEELLDDLNICSDERYLPEDEIQELKSEGWRVHKLINGYIRFLRGRAARDSSRVRKASSDDDPNEGDLEELFVGRFNSSSLQPFNE